MNTNSNGIAIIGMSGRFPGAKNVEKLWQNLMAGVESISFFSDEELASSGIDVAALKKGPGYVAARGILKDSEWLDAAFFNISSQEAKIIDPQQRLFLEASWEALEDAGIDPARAKTSIGVFAGMTYNSYSDNLAPGSGLASRDHLATRVAYKLNLRGPALSIHTACSTSLVAVCQACQALLCYQCDLALTGGVSVMFPQKRAYYPEGGMLSSDGHCRPFDAQASGTIFSDGLGVVVLKRLVEALHDGDQIYAVIKGFALNNDGSTKVGFAAPSVDGQAEVIALALAQAGIEPGTISYVEAHGTATPLGDPIEIAGLTKAFRASTSQKNFCAIGSIKGNVGHMDAAAGVSSLIKTALALKYRVLPPSLHFTQPNPQIDFADSPFFVNSKLTAWKAGATPRRAGVSGFGVGGTNAHVVLEEAPPAQPSGSTRDWQLLLVSAKTSSAVDSATANLCEHLKANPGLNLADAAFTLQTRRHAFDHRRMLVCRDRQDAIRAFEGGPSKRIIAQEGKIQERSVVFMFPGQGAQYLNMGAELYRAERAFKEEVDRCAEILIPHLGFDLRNLLFPTAEKAATQDLLHQTRITQPALFVVEYALANLWMSWGVRPRAMIGHSVGEYVAACLAQVFTLEEALHVVAGRAQLVQAQPGGAMLAVRLPESELALLVADPLSIAAVNSPLLCVASGPFDAVTDLEARLKTQGVPALRLQTSHAFHSAMMDPVLQPLTKLLERIHFKQPSIPYVSNVTGRWVTDGEACDPRYWARHLRQTVRFADGVDELLKDPGTILLEVGPGRTLCNLANQHSAKAADLLVVPSLSTPDEEIPSLLTALGRLWLTGIPVDWSGFYKHEKRAHIGLPSYPFERKRFWIEPVSRIVARQPVHDELASTETASAVETMSMTEFSSNQHVKICTESTELSSCPDSSLAAVSRKQQILSMLTAEFQVLSSADLTEVGPSASFMEMGLDSLFLGQAILAIEKRFGIRVTFRQLLQEMTTLNDLADFLDRKLPLDALSDVVSSALTTPAEAPAAISGNPQLEAIQAQLQALSRQLELLRQASTGMSSIHSDANGEQPTVIAKSVEAHATRTEASSRVPQSERDAGKEEVFTLPLNDVQMELWLAAKSDPAASCAFNQIFLIHQRSSISCQALREALQELVDRHDALRTSFLPDGSGQQIHPNLRLHIPLRDFSSFSTAEVQSKLDEAVVLEDRTPFDLARAPLFRAQIFKLSHDHHVLLLTAHHIVLDGWSIGVLLRELDKVYPAKLEGRSAGLEPAMQYRDYLEWQNLPENRACAAEAEDYWAREFATSPDAVELPTDRTRPAVKTYRAATQNLIVNSELYRSLKKAAAANDCTIFTYLLASLKVWLHRLTGQDDLVIGVPAAGQVAVNGRNFQGSRSLVGHCVNLLPLRSRCDGKECFKNYLTNLNRVVIDAYEHQSFTFGSLVKKLNLPREAGRVPLISVGFNLSRVHTILQLPGWEVDFPHKDFNFFDLNIEIQETGGDLRIGCRFNSDLFDASTIERWLQHWEVLLEGILHDPEEPISMLPMLSESERRQVLYTWNETAAELPSDKCVHQLFEEQVEKTPDSKAVVFEGASLSYFELNRKASQLAHHLRELGVKPDARVAICFERGLDMIVALLAVLKAGGAYVPLDPAYPVERLLYMLRDSAPVALLTQGNLENLFQGNTNTFPVINLTEANAAWNNLPAANLEPGDVGLTPGHLAYVIYTSGSTGQPKGVMVEHRNITNYVFAAADRLDLQGGMTYATVSTIATDLGNTVLFPSLVFGGSLHIISLARSQNSESMAEYFDREGIDVLKIVPSHLAALQPENGPPRIMPRRRLILGGESSRTEWVEELSRLSPQCRIYNHYGPTETTVGVLTHLFESKQRGISADNLSLGRPLANCRIYILDLHGNPVPIGVSGELVIGGYGVARGYLNRPDLTAERFLEDPFNRTAGARMYRTGDRARYLPGGNIEFLGRIDKQVKIHGYRVELGEIEAALREHEGVREAVVLMRDTAPNQKQLTAYIVPHCADQPLWENQNTYILPDGSTICHLNKNETDYIYHEIFELQAYVKHGITIKDGDCIVDAGSNIGLFTVFMNRIARNLRVYCFEPNPAAFACLQANTRAWGADVTCFPYGLSRENRKSQITVYEGMSLLSGLYADAATEREMVTRYVFNKEQDLPFNDQTVSDIGQIVEERLRAHTLQVELRTLSGMISEQRIDRIDLLKVNVEKSELDVLEGLSAEDWLKIRQLVIEIDLRDNLAPIVDLLEGYGFQVLVEQDPVLKQTALHYIYAFRRSAAGLVNGHHSSTVSMLPPAITHKKSLTPLTLRRHLAKALPEYMIPAAYVRLNSLPLTPSGKLDRKALPAPQPDAYAARGYEPPTNETEEKMAAIWRDVLGVLKVGRDDNFFDLGGDSLTLMRVHSRIRDAFDQDIAMVDMFRCTTVRALAQHLSGDAAQSLPEKLQVDSEVRRNAMRRQRRLRQDLVSEVLRGASN